MAIPSPRYVEPMTPSLSADNLSTLGTLGTMTSPPVKRKIEEDGISRGPAVAEGKENGAPLSEKRPRTDKSATPTAPCGSCNSQAEGSRNGAVASSSASHGNSQGHSGLVELRQRKLVFKQSAHSFDIPRRKKLEFEAFLLDVQDGKEKLEEKLPEEYHNVIVLAGHEATSATEAHLINHLKKVLDMKDLADIIPNPIWSNLISRLFTLQQYGLLPSDFPSTSSGSRKIPAGLQIRCWEAKEPELYFTEEQMQVVRARQAERGQAREDVLAILKRLDDVEVLELVKGEKEEKGKKEKKGRVSTVQDSPAPSIDRKSREGTAASGTSRRSASPVKKGKMTPEEEEAARIKQEEREAKRIAKEEKRVQKEEKEAAKQAEIQKKEALMAKQKQTMSSFFKPKPTVKPATNSVAGPSKPTKIEVSDFDRCFKPVTFRPNVEWAPVNRFRYKRRSNSPESAGEDVEDWQPADHIRHHIRKTGSKSARTTERLPKGLKSAPLHGSVAEVWAECQDAPDPRKVLNRLKNNRKFPWKTLAFDQQVRPPYSGTFTKRSVVVGPRTPFAQDPMFDYSYDSGDDWVDDEGGEDVDDNAGIEPEDQDEEDEESEGEFDDWLDDAEEEEVMDVDENFVPPLLGDEPVFVGSDGGEQSKLPMKVVKKRDVPPKRVVKVVPTWKGPLWESEMGKGTEGMEMYRIQLLNDTPDSIDPFKYISTDIQQKYKAIYTTTAIGSNLSVRTLLSVEFVDAPAQVPAPAGPISSSEPFSTPAIPKALAESATSKPRPAGPKIAFPVSHLPELLKLIDGNKRIRTDLISQLKAHFDSVTSKAAIEQKLREVAVREGKSKDSAWKVLPEAWRAVGAEPPTTIAEEVMVVDA